MNEELQKQIANMLQAALAAAQKGGEWLSGQIPDVLHQLIVWTIVKGFLSFGLWLSIWIVVIWMIRSSWSKQAAIIKNFPGPDGKNHYWADRTVSKIRDEFEDSYFPYCFAFGGLGIINFVYTFFMWNNFFSAVQAWVAPKLFLLEYISHMVKG